MTEARRVKKSETLEIRLSYDSKAAFMVRCRDDGRTASEALRRFIEQEVEGAKPPRRGVLRGWSLIAASLAGLALGAVAGPSLAHPVQNSRALFDRLDLNHDGVLSFAEFRRR
jgi:hypothetical protein